MLFRDIRNNRNNRRTRLSEEAVDYREMVAEAVKDCQTNLDLIYWDVERDDIGTNRIVISKKKSKNTDTRNLITFADIHDCCDSYIGDVDDIIAGFDGTYLNIMPNKCFGYNVLKKYLPDTIDAFNELERIRKCIAKHF